MIEENADCHESRDASTDLRLVVKISEIIMGTQRCACASRRGPICSLRDPLHGCIRADGPRRATALRSWTRTVQGEPIATSLMSRCRPCSRGPPLISRCQAKHRWFWCNVGSTHGRRMGTPHRLYAHLRLSSHGEQIRVWTYLHIESFTLAVLSDGSLNG